MSVQDRFTPRYRGTLIDPPLSLPSSANRDTDTVVSEDGLPSVSICIPTLNDESTLNRCLQSFTQQAYPDVELVIVDGGSTDRTVSIARRYTEQIYFDDGTLGEARRLSVTKASGEIVGLFDGDIFLPHERWLANAVRLFDVAEGVSTVWPQNVAPPDASLMTRVFLNHWNVIIEDRIKRGRGYFGGGNSLFRRDCLDAIGGINPDIHWAEDFDWARRLTAEGYNVVYNRDPVYHQTNRTLRGFGTKQVTAAETFSETGFGLMGLTLTDVLYEQYILGLTGMYNGLVHDRDPSWLLYLPYIALRTIAYAYTFGTRRLKGLDSMSGANPGSGSGD